MKIHPVPNRGLMYSYIERIIKFIIMTNFNFYRL